MLVDTLGTLLSFLFGAVAMSKTLSFEKCEEGKIHIKINWVKFLFMIFGFAILVTAIQYLLGSFLPIDIV